MLKMVETRSSINNIAEQSNNIYLQKKTKKILKQANNKCYESFTR